MAERKVAALYTDPNGPYAHMADVDPWDIDRNATKYIGPWPVVAHPPCGPWGRLRKFCTKQDPSLAILAANQVMLWGGVLEHPAGSLLWGHLGLPKPSLYSGATPGDMLYTLQVEQCRWGHRAEKKTWLLLSKISIEHVSPIPPWQEPTACVDTRSKKPDRLIKMSSQERARTPVAFAKFLVDLARKVN